MARRRGGYYYAANNFSSAEHGGTHIDAPIHFARGGLTVDRIPLDSLIARAVVIDVTRASAQNAELPRPTPATSRSSNANMAPFPPARLC
jgi:kynurenine formamidase